MTERAVVAIDDEAPVAAIQAFYHKLTKKTETLRFSFPDSYEVTRDDLCNLYRVINQSLTQYNKIAYSSEIVVSLENNESREFSSLDKFQMMDFSTKSKTKSFSIKFDFVIKLPTEVVAANDIPQRYAVSVLVDQHIRDDFDFPPVWMRKFVIGDNISARIEYSDYAVANALRSAISTWVDGLSQKKISPLWKWLFDNDQALIFFLTRIGLASVFVGAGRYFVANDIGTLSEAFSIAFFCFSIAALVFGITQFASGKLFEVLHKIAPVTYILITKGDSNRHEEAKSKQLSRSAWAFVLFSSILVGLPFAVLGNWVSAFVLSK